MSIPRKILSKYDRPTCYRIDFSEEGLNAIRYKYRAVQGQPVFIDDILKLRPSSHNLRLLRYCPELIEWSNDGDALMLPNYPYMPKDRPITSGRDIAANPEGYAAIAWYIHPEQLKESVFSNPQNRQDHGKATSGLSFSPYAVVEPNKTMRRSWQETIGAIEKRSETYLASILDLTNFDLPWLRQLKMDMIGYLEKNYGLSSKDNLDLYFHSLIPESTTTLHLHARVNQKVHGLEASDRFYLDDIIDTLEKGGTIKDMMLAKGCVLKWESAGVDFLKDLPSVEISEVDNPYSSQSQPKKQITVGFSEVAAMAVG